MSESFEKIVLQKFDEIQQQVNRIPEMDKKISNLKKQVAKMPEIGENINNINRTLILIESEFKDKVPVF